MYAREDTVNWLLAKRANTNTLGGPLKQSCVHLASARRSGQAHQVDETVNMMSWILMKLYLDCQDVTSPKSSRDEVQRGS